MNFERLQFHENKLPTFKENKSKDIYNFGDDNLYPELLVELFEELHRLIVINAGFDVNNPRMPAGICAGQARWCFENEAARPGACEIGGRQALHSIGRRARIGV